MTTSLSSLIGGGGGLPIGASILAQGGQDLMTFGDGSVWLRAGVLALASLYPEAAKLSHLGAHGFTPIAAGSPVGSGNRRMATNGSGRYMLADRDNSLVRMSNDYGKTWTNVGHGLGVNASDIICVGTTWIVVGNNDAAVYAAISTNGTSFGARITVANISEGAETTAQIAHSGTLYYIAVAMPSTNSVWSSSTGASGTWAGLSLASGISGQAFALSAGNGRALVTIGNQFSAQRIVGSGNAVSVSISPALAAGWRHAYFKGKFYLFSNSGQYTTSTDLTTFSGTIGLPTQTNVAGNVWTIADGRLIYAGNGTSGFVSTTDGESWNYQSSNLGSWSNVASTAFAGDATGLVLSGSAATSVHRAESTFAAPNYVGRAVEAYSSGSQMVSPVLYYRVK